MVRSCLILLEICLLLISLYSTCRGLRNVAGYRSSNSSRHVVFPIGVVLNMMSPRGSMLSWCIKTAVSDFYAAHPHYGTRLELHSKNAENLLEANFAVLDLLDQDKVIAILGPEEETEITFVAELAKKVDVPVISFTARSSGVTYENTQYLVRTSPDDAIQAQAFAAICQGFEWYEVVVLYEDTDYGYRFLSHLNKALQEVDVGIDSMLAISIPLDDHKMFKELKKLATKQTRVFLVDVSPSHSYDLFTIARKTGLMSEGYAWIISDRLSIFVDSMDFVAHHSMEGVLGIRPTTHRGKELEYFQKRWKRKLMLEERPDVMMELNHYGLWAYDAITALAIAVEKVGHANTTSLNVNQTEFVTGNRSLQLSELGPMLLNELTTTRFVGLSGEFMLIDGILKQSAFEIFNVYGSGERTIGFWTPDKGIIRELNSVDEKPYSVSTKELKRIIWPGDSVALPKSLAISGFGSLKVGVPLRDKLAEFGAGRVDPITNRTIASGFAVDIFFATLDVLPIHITYEFRLFSTTNGYDFQLFTAANGHATADGHITLPELPQKLDMIVADITIMSSRSDVADFSHPYTESGVVLVVRNTKPFDMWTFIKPLRWDLWLAIILACILMGIVLRVLEQRVTRNEGHRDTHNEKLAMGYWSPVTVLAFPDSNMVSNSWSLLVLVFWLFMAFILMQSYTANLSAILTVDQLKFAFSDDYNVGCQVASFVKQFLTEQLNISPERVRNYTSLEEYHHAMTIGSKHGGIDAIFDEIPYMKLFLNKYDSQYKMVGPTYKTGGFGFAFPLNSPLTKLFSKAILNVTQGLRMTAIEQRNFGPGYSSQDPLSSTISQGTSSLTVYQFAGLFLIVGSVTIFALLCSETPIGRKFSKILSRFLHVCFHFKASKVDTNDASVNGDAVVEGGGEVIQESVVNNVIALNIEEGSNEPPVEEVLQVLGRCEIQEECPSDDLCSTRVRGSLSLLLTSDE